MKSGLLLTRREGESCVCYLGDKELAVIVEKIDGTRVRLRFIGDRSINVVRTEILEEGE
jgi:sRNA-binding carbon storage regulator CsrA